MDFTPLIDRYEPFDLKFFAMIPHQVFGYFNGKVEFRTKWDGEVLGEAQIDGTNIWTDRECSFAPVSGVNALYIKFVGGGSCSMKCFELLH